MQPASSVCYLCSCYHKDCMLLILSSKNRNEDKGTFISSNPTKMQSQDSSCIWLLKQALSLWSKSPATAASLQWWLPTAVSGLANTSNLGAWLHSRPCSQTQGSLLYLLLTQTLHETLAYPEVHTLWLTLHTAHTAAKSSMYCECHWVLRSAASATSGTSEQMNVRLDEDTSLPHLIHTLKPQKKKP